jgi:CheY-like chemotaxis protein
MGSRATKSAKEALHWLEAGEQFDVVLLDFVMPDMDGQALADAINSTFAEKRPPLIMVSSFGLREQGHPGIDAFLTKPLKPSVLHDALATVLAGASVTSRQRRAPEKPVIDATLAERYPLRILLAEDNAVNQKLALRLLERMGYGATVAHNGREALEAVERDTFDVVLMDVQMPEMDGLEATRRILAAHGAGAPRIVAMTANAMAEDREACLAAGMADYLTKPIRVEELADALARSAVARA